MLKPDHEDLASELEIDMAIQYLKQKQFSQVRGRTGEMLSPYVTIRTAS